MNASAKSKPCSILVDPDEYRGRNGDEIVGDEWGNTYLMAAAEHGDVQEVKRMISAGANVNIQSEVFLLIFLLLLLVDYQ